ncbi:MAG: M20/M25/M40 family metallo-hydrolase [Anaerolineae bacterium]|jgi:acetylornithine deacetylase/succinyl-diaminopimelate desuccinylase-like protein
MSTPSNNATIYERPAELLQNLIRFDTTNPPGNEAQCVAYINDLLTEAGFETNILAKNPNRSNLLARLEGRGDAPPLLLYGHADVVTTAHQEWTHPPFEGKIVDGYVWGRGALDMKGGLAMMLAALLRARAEGLKPAGDVVLAVLSDEEAGGFYGARYLVEEHAEHFQGIRYALGEFGGVPMYIGQKKFYLVQVAEKQICWLKATVRGPGGHGSAPMRGGAMAKLARLLQKLDQHHMPIHVTPVARLMVEEIASALPFPTSLLLRQLLNPALVGNVLKLMGDKSLLLESLLKNTVNATIVHGGEKFNVIPSEIVLQMDGRLLPGYSPDDMIAELRRVIGDEVDLDLVWHDPGPAEPDMGLFNLLTGVLRDADPDGMPIPLLLPGVTDARFFSQLGIQTYGFTPLDLPQEFNFFETIHAADERVPVNALAFGVAAIYEVLRRYQDQ